MEVYKTIFDTWRSQVDSSWQRSSYFAAFEIAAVGGCWLLVSGLTRLPVGAGIVFSVGLLLDLDLVSEHEDDPGVCASLVGQYLSY